MGILRSQLVNMNQHYRRFSLDYFLDCQQRLCIRQIELWCGASHFWLDHEGTGDVPALKQKLLDHDVRVVSVTAPSIAYQYQYASQEPELLESIERLTPDIFARVTGSDKAMCANVDMYSGLMYRMLGISPDLFTPLFAVARITGWCAHRMEEVLTGGRIYRPAYKPLIRHKDYVPFDER